MRLRIKQSKFILLKTYESVHETRLLHGTVIVSSSEETSMHATAGNGIEAFYFININFHLHPGLVAFYDFRPGIGVRQFLLFPEPHTGISPGLVVFYDVRCILVKASARIL